MTTEQFQGTVEQAISKVQSVLVNKRIEYAKGNDDPFHNFRNAVGLSMQNSKEAVAWEFLVKHLQSMKDIITYIEKNNHTNVNTDLLDEKAIDIINYILLIRGMIIERIERDN